MILIINSSETMKYRLKWGKLIVMGKLAKLAFSPKSILVVKIRTDYGESIFEKPIRDLLKRERTIGNRTKIIQLELGHFWT